MEDTIYCDICDEFVEYDIINKKEEYNIMNKEIIKINADIAKCSHCGTELFHEELDKKNQRKAFDIYRDKKSILYPQEIKEIRNKYGLTQKEISNLLGWGDITYHRYEKGSLPDRAHNNQLILIKDPFNVKKIIETGNHDLEKDTVKKLKDKIKELTNTTSSKIKINCPNKFYKKLELEANKAQMTLEEYTRHLLTKYYYEDKIEKIKKETKKETVEKMIRSLSENMWFEGEEKEITYPIL